MHRLHTNTNTNETKIQIQTQIQMRMRIQIQIQTHLDGGSNAIEGEEEGEKSEKQRPHFFGSL